MGFLVHVLQWSFIFIHAHWIVIWKVRSSKVHIFTLDKAYVLGHEKSIDSAFIYITKFQINLPSSFTS